MISPLGKIIKKGYEETLLRKISDCEQESLMGKILRDNFKRKSECKEKGIVYKRPSLTKEYLESLLKEDCKQS
mgnify:CR=1 FL=1